MSLLSLLAMRVVTSGDESCHFRIWQKFSLLAMKVVTPGDESITTKLSNIHEFVPVGDKDKVSAVFAACPGGLRSRGLRCRDSASETTPASVPKRTPKSIAAASQVGVLVELMAKFHNSCTVMPPRNPKRFK